MDTLRVMATIGAIFIMAMVHGGLGWMTVDAPQDALLAAYEQSSGKLVVDYSLPYLRSGSQQLDAFKAERPSYYSEEEYQAEIERRTRSFEDLIENFPSRNAWERQKKFGGSEESQEQRIRQQYEQFGLDGFIEDEKVPKASLSLPDSIPASYWPFASFMLLWWLTMIVFQGEGLNLDIQRRRHPMWEWLLSHPVRPIAAFAADMLSPLMANPVYFTAPLFWWILLGPVHGVGAGLLGALPVGLAFAVAASCLNKALEIAAMLRFSPRNRGAVLGVMSWLGYAAMMLPLFSLNLSVLKVYGMKWAAEIAPWTSLWPARVIMMGWGAQPSWWQAVVSGLLVAAVLFVLALAVAWWGLRRGLQANDVGTRVGKADKPSMFGRRALGHALYRKELLWFWRDKGAVVQAFLIPLAIASFQVFNLRGILNEATNHWNGVCGAAVLCGTYFLLVLGPRSLASEGGALWISMTWPQGLESLLKAKARLWWMISNIVVAAILTAAILMFPNDWWRVGLVAVGWLFFGRSLAEKSVTSATAPSSSGEPEPAPQGRQWAVMAGTLAFGTGVITGRWEIAMSGVVFSALSAAAMWQNFRSRLPFLFDPWSEKLPQAPTLLHAMIAIAAMIEGIALISGIAFAIGGNEWFWPARTMAYGVVGLIAWIVMTTFLDNRGVSGSMVRNWGENQGRRRRTIAGGVAILAGCGLGALAHLYTLGLQDWPLTREYMLQITQANADMTESKIWMGLLAVGLAPFAEEYFFRGLLYRALDREWGGWRAMVGSAAYFALYHPPISWLPVFALGFANAWLFRKSGSLIPCVLFHMAYNAMVVWLS